MDFDRLEFEDRTVQKRYDKLCSMDVRATRYPHRRTMQDLGIKAEVLALYDRVGWKEMTVQRWATYPELVVEFLATMRVNDNVAPKQPLGIWFRLRNQEYYLGRDELDEILGCPTGGEYFYSEDFDPVGLWKALAADATCTPETFQTSNCKASSIDNPVIRYIHRANAVSVYGRNESGKVRNFDLFCLWSMLKGQKLSLAGQMMDTWKRQAAASAPGRIWSGGLITPIAQHVGVELDAFDNAPHSQHVDKELLVQMQMLHVFGDQCYLRLSNGDGFPLPNTPLTTVSDLEHRRNWHMHTSQHLALCRSLTGRQTAIRLAPGQDLSQDQDEEPEQMQEQMQGQEYMHQQGQFQAGPSGTQYEATHFGGGMSSEQWATLQAFMERTDAFMGRHDAFMERQEAHNASMDTRVDTLTDRVRAVELNLSELMDMGRDHVRQQRQEDDQNQWSGREPIRYYERRLRRAGSSRRQGDDGQDDAGQG